MNEFIVWDKVNEEFFKSYSITFGYDFKGGTVTKIGEEKRFLFPHDVELFYCIRKTDKDGSKIYADCSIVEFEYKDNVFRFSDKGYFKFNELDLCFTVVTKETVYKFDRFIFTNLKVIGTLQQDKHLLGEAK